MLATLVEPFTYDYMRNAILVSALVGGVCLGGAVLLGLDIGARGRTQHGPWRL